MSISEDHNEEVNGKTASRWWHVLELTAGFERDFCQEVIETNKCAGFIAKWEQVGTASAEATVDSLELCGWLGRGSFLVHVFSSSWVWSHDGT